LANFGADRDAEQMKIPRAMDMLHQFFENVKEQGDAHIFT
jgi:hypothetical protein